MPWINSFRGFEEPTIFSSGEHVSEKNQWQLQEQRERLLTLNDDTLVWVYKVIQNDDGKISLQILPDILTCYGNKFPLLKWVDENKDISIIDMDHLRKWKVVFLTENRSNISEANDLILLSNGVIEFLNIEKSTNFSDYHIYTSLRDNAAADKLQRTSVAWRNTNWNLLSELEKEYIEETPFLSQINWVWTLAIPELTNKEEAIDILKKSVQFFLTNKYTLDRNNPEDVPFIDKFEKSFKWSGLSYEQLWTVLQDIIQNNNIVFFKNQEFDDIRKFITKDIKELTLTLPTGEILSTGNYFVYHDKQNNTIEYRSIRKIEVPTWFDPQQRLYLESRNQDPKLHRIHELDKEPLVPTIMFFKKQLIWILEKYESK